VLNNKKHGLGRSFESLIPTELLDDSFDPTSHQDSKVSKLVELKLDHIQPDANQPRKHFDQPALEKLADSIKTYGVLQPIVVAKSGEKYTIVAGERRYRASKLAGKTTIPAIVRTLSSQHKLEISLIENVQRKDLNVLEVATAYTKLRDQFNMSPEEIGKKAGDKSATAITNTIRLLRLPEAVKQAIVAGNLSEGQAKPLINVDHKIIEQILPTILKEGWSARKVEQFVVNLKKSGFNTPKLNVVKSITAYGTETKSLENRLKAKISVSSTTKGRGRITIKFDDEADFKRITDLILK